MTEKIAGVSTEAVANATGHPWAYWLDLLDDQTGETLTHKERVATLAAAGVQSGWWQQQLAVGYEHARGLREVGETATAGFQVGVQRTIPVAQDRVWDVVTSDTGLRTWLGVVESFEIEPGVSYRTTDGTAGDVRTVSPGERIRLTWHPPDRDQSTTLQLTLSCTRNDDSKTVLRIHHEKLRDATEREAMRDHWKTILDTLTVFLEPTTD